MSLCTHSVIQQWTEDILQCSELSILAEFDEAGVFIVIDQNER